MLGALVHAVIGLEFTAPHIDYHALAPEIVLTATLVAVLLADLFLDETKKYLLTTLGGLGLLASVLPVVTLALKGDDRLMFGGGYVVDDFALVLKAMFLIVGYVVLLMSSNYIQEGDYHEGEYVFLMLCSILGMVAMCSARDLISIFVALETLSIPAYLLAGWRKRDLKSNEAALKYYLLGVVASAVMLYGMSLVYGWTGATGLREIGAALQGDAAKTPLVAMGIFLIVCGFAFKVSAVPFHQWAPDTYEGAPTPVTAFLSVASKAAGFVALMELVFVGFLGRKDVWQPIFWVLAALTMTVGNLIALRQTNIVRMLAYSSVAQAGFILAPFAVAGREAATKASFTAVVVYLLVYAVMNLGAFTMVIAVARKTRSGEISSYGGLLRYAPALTVAMTLFMASLAGIPPLAGFWAKFFVFRAIAEAGGAWGWALGAIAAVNSVIAFYYYAGVLREMWFRPVPDGDTTPVRVPQSLQAALALSAIGVVVIGVYPSILTRFGDLARLVT